MPFSMRLSTSTTTWDNIINPSLRYTLFSFPNVCPLKIQPTALMASQHVMFSGPSISDYIQVYILGKFQRLGEIVHFSPPLAASTPPSPSTMPSFGRHTNATFRALIYYFFFVDSLAGDLCLQLNRNFSLLHRAFRTTIYRLLMKAQATVAATLLHAMSHVLNAEKIPSKREMQVRTSGQRDVYSLKAICVTCD